MSQAMLRRATKQTSHYKVPGAAVNGLAGLRQPVGLHHRPSRATDGEGGAAGRRARMVAK